MPASWCRRAPEVGHLVRLGLWLGKALHEGHKDHVAAEVTGGQPPAQRQVLKVAAPHAAEDDEAQVDARGGEPHHPQRRTTMSSGSTASWALPAYTTSDMNTAMGSDMPLFDHGHARDQPQAPMPSEVPAMSLPASRNDGWRITACAGPRATRSRGHRAGTQHLAHRQRKAAQKVCHRQTLAPARCRVVRRRAPPSPQATVTPSGPDAKICPQRSLDKRGSYQFHSPTP